MKIDMLTDKKKAEYVLPSNTQSLCPVCIKVIDANLYEKDGKIFMSKNCDMHGSFNELISTDAQFFLKMHSAHYEMPLRPLNPHCTDAAQCPQGCGLCNNHLSTPVMVNIDLTNRCNMNCPICFASSNTAGRVYELTIERVGQLIEKAVNIKPAPPACLQFVGGEPTIYKDFIKAIRLAKAGGFTQIQAASNGLRFAQSLDFCQEASDAGLDHVYLQFDGMDDQIYVKMRGRPLLETKLKAIENIAKANMRVTLVPTVVRGLNNNQIGEITRFAINNVDVIGTISWQPVAITGRIDGTSRHKMRYTTADLAKDLQEQCGFLDMHRDWFPHSVVSPFIRLMEAITGERIMRCSCHPHCGCATYLMIDKLKGTAVPLPKIIDIEPAMQKLNAMAERVEKHSWTKKLSMLQTLHALRKHFHPEYAPEGWKFEDFLEFTQSYIDFKPQHADKKSYIEGLRMNSFGSLLLTTMHFQDIYNYEIDRSRHCIIFYAAPNGRFYPFCTWNSGPCHRYPVERLFSRPLYQIQEIVYPQSVPIEDRIS